MAVLNTTIKASPVKKYIFNN